MTHRTQAVRDGEAALTKSLAKNLKAIGRQVAKKLRTVGKAAEEEEEEDKGIDAALDAVDWGPIAAAAQHELAAVAEDAAQYALKKLGIDDEEILNQTYTAAREWAANRAAELVGKKWKGDELVDNPNAEMAITDATRSELRALVADAIDKGLSAKDLANSIEDMGGFSAERAELIARTEILRSNNAAHLESFRASGVVSKKAWSVSGNEEVCDECQDNADEGEIDLDDDFPSGDDAPPGHPRCECVLTAIVDEDAEASDADSDDGDSEEDDT